MVEEAPQAHYGTADVLNGLQEQAELLSHSPVVTIAPFFSLSSSSLFSFTFIETIVGSCVVEKTQVGVKPFGEFRASLPPIVTSLSYSEVLSDHITHHAKKALNVVR